MADAQNTYWDDVQAVFGPAGGPAGGRLGFKTGFWVPADWGTNWRTARSAARQVNVVCFGDSIFEGGGSSDLLKKSVFGLVINGLRSAFGDGGSGFHSVVDAPGASFSPPTIFSTAGGSWTSSFCGMNDQVLIGPALNATLVDTLVAGTAVDVYYNGGGAGVGGGNFTVTVDGGTPVAATSLVAPMQIGKVTVSGLSPGLHSVVVTQSTSTGCMVFGVVGRNPSGILGWNMSHWGRASGAGGTGSPLADPAWFAGIAPTAAYASIANIGAVGCREVIDAAFTNGSAVVTSATGAFTAADVGKNVSALVSNVAAGTTVLSVSNATTLVMSANALASTSAQALSLWGPPGHVSIPQSSTPDLLIVPLGINDTSVPTAPATFGTNIRQYFDLARQSNPSCELVGVLCALGNHADAGLNYRQYAREMRSLCEAYGAAYVNYDALARNAYGTWSALGYWGDGLGDGKAGTDSVHPSDAGSAFMANTLLPLLTA